MPASFLLLAEQCAPAVDPTALAAIISIESGFNPNAIRINSGPPLNEQPATRDEAVALAASLMAAGELIDIGLGGISVEAGRDLDLSITDMFDPCLNMKATGRLLARSLKSGAGDAKDLSHAFASYFGQGDAEAGFIVGYDKRALAEMAKLAPQLADIQISTSRVAELPFRGEPGQAAPKSALMTNLLAGQDAPKPDPVGVSACSPARSAPQAPAAACACRPTTCRISSTGCSSSSSVSASTPSPRSS
ncbi:MAG: transglycosylase SLT domain-containing protein, partial [Microvirga sp.]|nr:transglycosylase SLT domain-containing protein [Microvirga sp.]